jgi:heterodisulfide reductase subunit C
MARLEAIYPVVQLSAERDAIKEAIAPCYQCGTCSATCPTAHAMDYSPRTLWRLVELGQFDELLKSNTFWMCTACYSCTVRCPREIPIGISVKRSAR